MATTVTTAKEAPKETVKYIEVERKEAKPAQFNVWVSAPRSEWEYVTIPKEDLHGYIYPEIMINHDKFNEYHPSYVSQDATGFKFLVPPMLAGEIKRIIDRAYIETVALLQPKKRMEALRNLQGHPGATRVAAAGLGSTAEVVGVPGAVIPA